MQPETITALIIFAVMYVLLLVFTKYRPYIALTTAVVFIIIQRLSFAELFSLDEGALDFNVLMMLLGTMGTVSLFIESKMPMRLADIIINRVPNVKWAIIALSLFSGIISAFVDNVATVLMVAPVAIAICRKQNISPVLSIIAISVSSNLQGAATLVGDTTSILLAGELNLNFIDFFWYNNRPGMFFITEAGALLATLILFVLLRKEKEKLTIQEPTKVEDYFPTVLLLSTVVLLIGASFLPDNLKLGGLINGTICMSLMVVGCIVNSIKQRNVNTFSKVAKDVDYYTILLLVGLFIVIKGITKAGVIDVFTQGIIALSNDNVFLLYTIIVWASVLISAFIDNIPYVLTMLTVIAQMMTQIQGDNSDTVKAILCFGLLVGATLGGNLTPIGASANITGIGILRKEGYEVKTKDFLKIGIPFTLVAVSSGYVLVWLFWGM